ncbi:MAG TPA: DUF4760 domain-containing protein [Candidatus Babeliales bacterium]|nr:DUF4760 domain-containing protein [Candidatus Babeliales bacterium]
MLSEYAIGLIYWIAAIIAVGSSTWIGYEAGVNPGGNYWHLAPIIGSVLVALGWIVTTQTMMKTNMRQHTITVMLHYDTANVSQRHRKLIIEYLPSLESLVVPGDRIPTYDDEGSPFYEALDYELNYFDFMASGVFKQVLDEQLLRDSFNSKFLYFYRCARPYIDHVQNTYGNERIWGNFCSLCEKWEKTPVVTAYQNIIGNPYSMFRALADP